MLDAQVKPVTALKSRTSEMLAHVNETRSPLIVTQNGEARAVLMDMESYRRMRDALLILKLAAQSEEDFRKGRWLTQRQVESKIRKKFSR